LSLPEKKVGHKGSRCLDLAFREREKGLMENSFSGPESLSITKEQFKKALSTEGILKDRSLELLALINDAPSCRATARQLAQIFGYEDLAPVNALIGKLGKRIANHLGLQLPERPSNSPGWWRILATGEYTPEGFAWSLRKELLEALNELGLLADRENEPFPDAVFPSGLAEGAVRQISVNAYERNSTARRLCINHYGTKCKVCDFSFASVYGSVGEGFIHVHHLEQLADIRRDYQVDPVNDLIPVCPNCHAMLHSCRPAMTIAELQSLMNQQGSSTNSSDRKGHLR
jgi:5-methylcytosine-specific restriction protein A